MTIIPFNKPYLGGKELRNISQAHARGQFSGVGIFTEQCQEWLEDRIGCRRAMLTHSCTAALEMAAILVDIQPGDEVIMPSYTFVSTANAFVLRGGVPVFVDIREDTLNIDEARIENAITEKTKAIVPVHYAGVGCEMDAIMEIAGRHNLMVIEDAAQGAMSTYEGRPLGSIGHIGCLSFHETKNITSGEGGALLINDASLVERAEIIRQNGTNRNEFFRGKVNKYMWVDIGSSYLPGEITAAFLWAQIEEVDNITNRRLAIWNRYHSAFESLENAGRVQRPYVPNHCLHNAHMYYLMLPYPGQRELFIDSLKSKGIHSVFHYVPLHDSLMGRRCGITPHELKVTDEISERLVRLPLWLGIEEYQPEVIRQVRSLLS